MRFTKMEGLGNDYVYVNCFREKVYDPEILARLVSDRHRGIGGDGLILIGPSARADFNMDIYNADGSRAEMCGNGIRCLGKYVYDHGMTEKTEIFCFVIHPRMKLFIAYRHHICMMRQGMNLLMFNIL